MPTCVFSCAFSSISGVGSQMATGKGTKRSAPAARLAQGAHPWAAPDGRSWALAARRRRLGYCAAWAAMTELRGWHTARTVWVSSS